MIQIKGVTITPEFKSTPTAVSVEFTSPTDSTPKMNCHLNSNCSCLSLESHKVSKCERSDTQAIEEMPEQIIKVAPTHANGEKLGANGRFKNHPSSILTRWFA